jgi:outer membrane murein-binding lipoprotein Lpp
LPIAAALGWLAAIAVDATVAGSERNRWQDLLSAEVRELSVQRKLQEDIARTVTTIKQGEAARANPKGALLAALSAAIPRTDWLNEISIKDGSVTLRGYALKPEEVTKALEPFARRNEVRFQGESAYDARLDRTRFAVSFRLAGTTP